MLGAILSNLILRLKILYICDLNQIKQIYSDHKNCIFLRKNALKKIC